MTASCHVAKLLVIIRMSKVDDQIKVIPNSVIDLVCNNFDFLTESYCSMSSF